MNPPFEIGWSALPLVTVALHAGHDVRPEVADRLVIDDAHRRREEDPGTERAVDVGGVPVVVHRSRFEVDLNRPRDRAVYRRPEDAWDLDIWRSPPDEGLIERSLSLHDRFYAELGDLLDGLAAQGPFLVLDVHSYNHRRDGASAPPAPVTGNPEVNVGTGTLDRDRFGGLVEVLVEHLRRQEVAGHHLDVRENVRFKGGHLCHWVHERYPGLGAALAVELKKTYMDEWTGEIDDAHLGELVGALDAVVPLALGELACGARCPRAR